MVPYWRSHPFINPSTKTKARVYVLTNEEGGRHTPSSPVISLSFISERLMSRGLMILGGGVEMVMPGITQTWKLNLGIQLRLKRIYGLQSARVGVPSVQA
ncbi:MAG: hypothetical protein CM1200mP39_29020 [Dehalococcoidia bacterium]|nr:MAG: hypothetical protein CM1200mP39_29020 [Dehalococcoidia bacterium]